MRAAGTRGADTVRTDNRRRGTDTAGPGSRRIFTIRTRMALAIVLTVALVETVILFLTLTIYRNEMLRSSARQTQETVVQLAQNLDRVMVETEETLYYNLNVASRNIFGYDSSGKSLDVFFVQQDMSYFRTFLNKIHGKYYTLCCYDNFLIPLPAGEHTSRRGQRRPDRPLVRGTGPLRRHALFR